MDWGYYYLHFTGENNEAPRVESESRSWILLGHHYRYCSGVYTWGLLLGREMGMEMKRYRGSWSKWASLLDWRLEAPLEGPSMSGHEAAPWPFPGPVPRSGVNDRLHTEQAVLSGWNPALFFDSGITGESREGKGRKHKKFQHMSSICNVIYVFWAKLLYTLWGELQINDETFWNMAYT